MTLVQKHPQDESYSFAVCVILVGPRSIQRKEKWTGFQSRGVIFTQTQVIRSILKSKPIPFFLLQERSSLWPTIKQLQFRRGERHLPLENRHKSELKPEQKKRNNCEFCFFSLRPISLARSMYLTLGFGTQSPQTPKRLSMLQIRWEYGFRLSKF